MAISRLAEIGSVCDFMRIDSTCEVGFMSTITRVVSGVLSRGQSDELFDGNCFRLRVSGRMVPRASRFSMRYIFEQKIYTNKK